MNLLLECGFFNSAQALQLLDRWNCGAFAVKKKKNAHIKIGWLTQRVKKSSGEGRVAG